MTARAQTEPYASQIHYYATLWGVNEDHLTKTIACESNFSATIQGDDGNSIGIAQISLIWNPTITYVEATNVDFSLNFMARNFAEGHANYWSCWKILEKDNWE